MIINKIISKIKYLEYYFLGNMILIFHYKKDILKDSKHLYPAKQSSVYAEGWQWIVNDYFNCRRKKVNLDVTWPVSADIRVVHPENIDFHPDDLNNFQTFGCYYQGIGRITIGKGTYIAPNVGIITANHNLSNLETHTEPRPVILGDECWIGINSVVLPGVTLGNKTIVGAGSVVTKSFEEGYCIIAGNPAKLIRRIGKPKKGDLYEESNS